jgi:hypothetical protein
MMTAEDALFGGCLGKGGRMERNSRKLIQLLEQDGCSIG